MMNARAAALIRKLELAEHPEGGYFKEVFRSEGKISEDKLGKPFEGDRNFVTSIYFLLTSEKFSAFHRINQDETWHFYDGSPIEIHMIDEAGTKTSVVLGMDVDNQILPQFTVPARVWFAANVVEEDSYSLVGCTVAPGFDFRDFELAKRLSMVEAFPRHEALILRYTRL